MSTMIQAYKEQVGRQIRAARKQAGMSHDTLAKLVGSSRQHLIKLEHGRHLPGDDLLERIAKATGKPVQYFSETQAVDPGTEITEAVEEIAEAAAERVIESRDAA